MIATFQQHRLHLLSNQTSVASYVNRHVLAPFILLRAASAAHADNNLSAAGNTYKNTYEATSMHSGLIFVFIVNIVTAVLGVLFYRYVILREVGLLSPDEVRLLRKFPTFRRTSHIYTPFASSARAAPPMRWTDWHDFFTSTESPLSRDAQVYLLFQRACIATAACCAILASITLLPAYWFGGNATTWTEMEPANLLSLLRSDRGIFERLTSHNLPLDSPLFLIQLPVFVVVAACIIAMYSLVNVASGEARSVDEWLSANPSASSASILPSPPPRSNLRPNSSKKHKQQQQKQPQSSSATTDSSVMSLPSSPHQHHQYRPWTVFSRGLPRDISSADNLFQLFDAIFPCQVGRVELVCQGKVSEARLLRNLSSARHRLEYLYYCADEEAIDMPLPSQTLVGRIFSLFTPSRTRFEMIRDLKTKIASIKRDLQSRKAAPVKDFRGCAFISFLEPAAAASALRNFPMRVHKQLITCSTGNEGSSLAANNINHHHANVNNNHMDIYRHRHLQSNTVSAAPVAPLNGNGENSADSSIHLEANIFCRSNNSIIGEHRRTISDVDVPYFRNLYKGTANLLPSYLRNRILPSPTNALLQATDDDNENSRLISEARRRHYAMTKLRNMKAERAPKSGDIIWNNLGMSFLERSLREMVVQVMVFAVLILFTSPVTMLTALRLVFSELSALTDPHVIFGNNNMTSLVSSSPMVSKAVEMMSLKNLAMNIGMPVGRLAVDGGHDAVGGGLDGRNDDNGLHFFSNLSADSGAAVESLSQDLLNVLPSFLTSNTYLTTAILTYFPVLLLSFIFSIVPSLLRFTCALEGYPTRSAMEMSVFRKTTFYYVMNSVVLPSLALNTASEFLEMLYQQSGGGVNVTNALPIFQRLFSGDIAYFLCCYLVQLALTGSVFWLMRVPQTLSMIIRRRMAVTPLEVAEAKCAGIFDYPRHYAYCVTVMSMALLFGMMAPLLWFFALFYFVCKHCVDVYTLRYVHPRTHIDGRLPKLSANFILTWTIVSELSFAVILYLQGFLRAAILTGILCVVTLIACLAAPSAVGNRMMSMVAVVRDAALDRMFSMFGNWFYRIDEVGGLSNSSSSSTMNSYGEISGASRDETDALLMNEMGRLKQEHEHQQERLAMSVNMKELGNDDDDDLEIRKVASSVMKKRLGITKMKGAAGGERSVTIDGLCSPCEGDGERREIGYGAEEEDEFVEDGELIEDVSEMERVRDLESGGGSESYGSCEAMGGAASSESRYVHLRESKR